MTYRCASRRDTCWAIGSSIIGRVMDGRLRRRSATKRLKALRDVRVMLEDGSYHRHRSATVAIISKVIQPGTSRRPDRSFDHSARKAKFRSIAPRNARVGGQPDFALRRGTAAGSSSPRRFPRRSWPTPCPRPPDGDARWPTRPTICRTSRCAPSLRPVQRSTTDTAAAVRRTHDFFAGETAGIGVAFPRLTDYNPRSPAVRIVDQASGRVKRIELLFSNGQPRSTRSISIDVRRRQEWRRHVSAVTVSGARIEVGPNATIILPPTSVMLNADGVARTRSQPDGPLCWHHPLGMHVLLRDRSLLVADGAQRGRSSRYG